MEKLREVTQLESDIRHFRVERQREQEQRALEQSASEKKPAIPAYVTYLIAALICIVAYNM